MWAHRLWNRQFNYEGPLGAATKENIYDPTAAPLDQQILFREGILPTALKEGATSWITDGSRGYRQQRDMNIDIKNPRQELQKDRASELAMDAIPNLKDQQIDISMKSDYEASFYDQIFIMSERHAQAQERMFTDPQAIENPSLSGENGRSPPGGTSGRNVNQDDLYGFGGSAAGLIHDRLAMDEDGAFINTVDSTVAF